MSLKAKYQYTHFIYPFVVESKNYVSFMNSLFSKEKDWNFIVREHKSDEEFYNFFLPYMRKFIFPTLFWSQEQKKHFKSMLPYRKSMIASKLTCSRFEYNLSNIKTGTVNGRRYDEINFDISKIDLICFEPGICFLDIKTQIEEEEDLIDFNKILDFNHHFRNLTPHATTKYDKASMIKGKNIDKLENISKFIQSVVGGFETDNFEKTFYDKMFTYSYVCMDNWKTPKDFEKMENDFFKFQYVIDSKSSAVFNKKYGDLEKNMYSRWQYSMFGFSRESGVVLVSDEEKYDITRMPYNFEKTYLYMMLLAFYQRMSLINFSQELLKADKTRAKTLKKKFTKFTNLSWFSQITNSEHGMDIWKKWQEAFELPNLFDEVRKEYIEYYDFVVATGQERINILLILLYTVSVIFTGLQVLSQYFIDLNHIQTFVIVTIIVTALSYPAYAIVRWIKHKLEASVKNLW